MLAARSHADLLHQDVDGTDDLAISPKLVPNDANSAPQVAWNATLCDRSKELAPDVVAVHKQLDATFRCSFRSAPRRLWRCYWEVKSTRTEMYITQRMG
jgi:hypothetical protein